MLFWKKTYFSTQINSQTKHQVYHLPPTFVKFVHEATEVISDLCSNLHADLHQFLRRIGDDRMRALLIIYCV